LAYSQRWKKKNAFEYAKLMELTETKNKTDHCANLPENDCRIKILSF